MAKPKIMARQRPLSLPADMVKAVDDYRFGNRIASESEAIRQLIRKGLEAAVVAEGSKGGGDSLEA